MAHDRTDDDAAATVPPTASIPSGDNSVWADVSPLLQSACQGPFPLFSHLLHGISHRYHSQLNSTEPKGFQFHFPCLLSFSIAAIYHYSNANTTWSLHFYLHFWINQWCCGCSFVFSLLSATWICVFYELGNASRGVYVYIVWFADCIDACIHTYCGVWLVVVYFFWCWIARSSRGRAHSRQ